VKRDLTRLLADLKTGRGPGLLLLFGDDLQVERTCRAVIDELVPEERRDFNLERFDGRVASWEQIEASLMTPPFLPGKKLLWVESAPYFFSKEQKNELGEKVVELWRDGKRDAAAKLFIDLLLVEGWTQERWERVGAASSPAVLELFGSEGADSAQDIEALVSYCKNGSFDLTQRKGAEDHRLTALLEQGLPEWSFLLLTAVQVDRRTRIYKRFEEIGAAFDLSVERDRAGKINRETLLEMIAEYLAAAGKTLDYRARELLLARTGGDLRSLQQEVEKLVLFVGDRPVIGAEDVENAVADRSEGWIFDLTRAVGDRDARAALSQLARLLAQGEAPLKILATITSEMRRLLAARQLLATDLVRFWRRGMSYQQFQQTVLKQGVPMLTRNPYADYMCFQRADSFSISELRGYMEALFAADYRLKSSGSQPNLVLERLVLGLCMRKKNLGLAARPASR
jgi:DNA polymerase-3 subunit delta